MSTPTPNEMLPWLEHGPYFKVDDMVRMRRDVKVPKYGVLLHGVGTVTSLGEAGTVVFLKTTSDWFFAFHPDDLELVSPADPRDAEIAALKARVAELESRQADEDRSVSKEKVQKALEQSHTGLPMILPDSLAVVPDDRAYFRQLVIELIRANRSNVMWEANGIFDEVKRREHSNKEQSC
jgi:hypothetical protein